MANVHVRIIISSPDANNSSRTLADWVNCTSIHDAATLFKKILNEYSVPKDPADDRD